MKKMILGVILTAGAVLAQSTGTAPANSGAKSGAAAAPSTQAPATPAPAAKAPVKKHTKSNKPVTANAAKPATPATPAAPASK